MHTNIHVYSYDYLIYLFFYVIFVIKTKSTFIIKRKVTEWDGQAS